jgi:hypothetical protein
VSVSCNALLAGAYATVSGSFTRTDGITVGHSYTHSSPAHKYGHMVYGPGRSPGQDY